MLSRSKLKKEVENVEKSIKQLQDTIVKCEDGILVNEIVLNAFKARLE